ncbi:hypothetical protein [Pseudomonas fluorescens]|uniref:Uncharacterized protein n=1 Tax=Pseudomonas fluorescens TaxID=294 RepID=A0A2T0HN44_PSEFL|nr:hypothetical protein [Pseudomonas fluorescens]PRW84437.1 hypothetical protein C7A10_28800 [Pseudomonas fluorescens]
MLREFTTDPIEGEVCAALAAYKWALIGTNYRSLWHRLMCSAGGKAAISSAAVLDRAEKHAQQVVSKTPEHRSALERIVRQQPEDVARKDRLFDLLNTTFES